MCDFNLNQHNGKLKMSFSKKILCKQKILLNIFMERKLKVVLFMTAF